MDDNVNAEAAKDTDLANGDVASTGARGTAQPGATGDPLLPVVTFDVSDEIVILSDRGSVESESIGALGAHLIAKHVHDGRRGLAICSSDATSGAAALATNLAIAFAQAGVRTLLIDCDLRAPQLHTLLTPSAVVPTLRDLLEDDTMNVGAAVQADVLPNLSVIYAGDVSNNVQELIASNRFVRVLDLCLRDFEITIVITPASRTSADARRIATFMRYALVIVRKNATFVSDVKALVDELKSDGVRVIGTVFNIA